jgi:hypothetical protein
LRERQQFLLFLLLFLLHILPRRLLRRLLRTLLVIPLIRLDQDNNSIYGLEIEFLRAIQHRFIHGGTLELRGSLRGLISIDFPIPASIAKPFD